MNLNRIAIIGISASGKSTISRILAERTKLPLIHMDQLFWHGNWQEVPEVEYLKEHQKVIQQDRWIIEGYVDKKMKQRLERSDLILYLDYSGLRCAWQLIKRWFKHRSKSRPELPKEALENFDRDFFWLVLTRAERLDIEEALNGVSSELIRIKSPRQLQQYMKDF